MSLSEALGRLLRAVVLMAPAVLAACTFSPVYGPAPTGRVVTADLSAITISSPPKPIDAPNISRIEQKVRNDLIFGFTGGGAAPPPRYTLKLSTLVSQTLLGVTRIETAPSYSVRVTVAYELADIQSGRIVARGVANGVASYDRLNQAFANVRAQQDAEERAASAAADDIRIRLAAALASGA